MPFLNHTFFSILLFSMLLITIIYFLLLKNYRIQLKYNNNKNIVFKSMYKYKQQHIINKKVYLNIYLFIYLYIYLLLSW